MAELAVFVISVTLTGAAVWAFARSRLRAGLALRPVRVRDGGPRRRAPG